MDLAGKRELGVAFRVIPICTFFSWTNYATRSLVRYRYVLYFPQYSIGCALLYFVI
jgi:hypothetical protein